MLPTNSKLSISGLLASTTYIIVPVRRSGVFSSAHSSEEADNRPQGNSNRGAGV